MKGKHSQNSVHSIRMNGQKVKKPRIIFQEIWGFFENDLNISF